MSTTTLNRRFSVAPMLDWTDRQESKVLNDTRVTIGSLPLFLWPLR